MGVQIQETFFPQDGARPHTANEIFHLLNEHFSNSAISDRFLQRFGYGWSWPPYSPDLNPCDYFLWWYPKDNTYRNNPHTADEMKEETEAAVTRTSPDTLGSVVANFQHQLQMMLDAGSSLAEYVFH
jgi:hypothetical protein